MLDEAAAATPAGSPGFVSVQNQYNILYREPEDGVLEWCDRTGMAFLPFFPLASGLLSGKYRAGEPPPEGTRLAAMGDGATSQLSDERLAAVAALDELAEREGHSVLDLAFGWLLSRPAVASVIAGATSPSRSRPTSPLAPGAPVPTCWPQSTPSRPASAELYTALAHPDQPDPDELARADGRCVTSATVRRPRPSCRPHGRHVDQQVVGDQRDGHVHRHQHGTALAGCPWCQM